MKLIFVLFASALAGDATLRALSGANDVVMLGGASALSKASGSDELHALPINLVESVTDTDTVLQLEAKAGKDAEIVFVDDGGANRVALVKPHGSQELQIVGGRLMIDGKDVAEAWTDLAAANDRIAELESQLATCSQPATAPTYEWYTMSGMSVQQSSEYYDGNHGAANTLLSHNASAMHSGDEVFWQADYGAHLNQWIEYDTQTPLTVNEFRYQPVFWNGPGTEPKEMYLYVDGARHGPFEGAKAADMSSPCLDGFKTAGLVPGDGQCLDLPFQTFSLQVPVTGSNFTFVISQSWGYTQPEYDNESPAIKRFGLGLKTEATTTGAPPHPLTQCDGYLQFVVDDAGAKHYCPTPPAAFPTHGTISSVGHFCSDHGVGGALTRDCVMEFDGDDTRYFEPAQNVLYNRATGATVGQGDVWVQMKVRADASRATGTLFDMGSDEHHVRLEYFTRADGATYVGFRSKADAGTAEVWHQLSAGEWHWVRGTKTEGQLTLQVDGSISTLADSSGAFDWSTFQKDCSKCETGEQLQDCINVGARATPGPYDRDTQVYNHFKGQITEFALGNQVGASAIVARPLSQCADAGNTCDAGPESGGHWIAPTMISGYPTAIANCTA